ncbi:MAG TPA: MFS transporter [Burkholderiales bacterium]|jgi:MFS family permease|nr:MFS transporter [Burkholderiales bacterium]
MNSAANWRTPVLVLVCGAIILTLGLGIRASFGLFLQPMSTDLGWGRSHFSFAMALSNLIWGLAQPFFGAWADKKGAGRVVAVSGLLYAGGLALMPFSTTPLMLDASAGLMVGLGLSGVSFGVILGVVGRAFPPERRSLALGIASSGGSFGQFLMLPFGQLLISTLGWQTALLVLAGTIMATVPLAAAMMEGRRPAATGIQQSLGEALREAGAHSGFWYLTAGFFVCGFQVAFISVHLPAYLLDVKMTPAVGATALALIGLFNIAGSFVAGYLGGRFSKKYLLSAIYILRAVIIALFLVLPVSPVTVYLFSAGIGFLWLGTVPLTNGLVAQIFGVRFVSMLFGIVFLSHQIGSFTGVWLGGYLFDATGSYNLVWIGSIALGVIAAILNLPIDERPVERVEARLA